MGITGCTDNYYSYELPWNASGDTVTPPHPVFTEGDNSKQRSSTMYVSYIGWFRTKQLKKN